MSKSVLCVLMIMFLTLNISIAQQKPKTIDAKRVTTTIKLDGDINEPAWKSAPIATEFVEYQPAAGVPEDKDVKTELFILYDNEAVYVAGFCHERSADSVSKELVGRDRIGSNDFAAVFFDTYHDKINASGFFVTPLGEQFDAKYGAPSEDGDNEDESWNAVWFSEAKIVKGGWTFEMKIPYSALRFNKQNTTWGINFMRARRKAGKKLFWNPVSPTRSTLVAQEGLWTGLTGIKSPIRLSFSPYFSTYLNHYPYDIKGIKNTTYSINGGMDLKYGINESYTLDMTVIPDFGQVQSDKKVLNLTPFEVKYEENRPFFTEGTELFNKGNLFYSRRIGSEPIHKYDIENSLKANEIIINNPSESKLYNALKISGRNKKGLGMGIFNAVTKSMYAELEDTLSGNKRKMQTAPLINYNIIALDQNLKNNSSISFVNTNVIRNGAERDANVSAAVFDIYNKKQSINVYGNLSASIINENNKYTTGYAHSLGIGKVNGRLNIRLQQEVADKNYDKNDMGILFNSDYMNHYLWIGYKWVKPGKWYNNIFLNYNNNLSHRFSDQLFLKYNTNINTNIQLKNLWWIGINANYTPKNIDIFEPRVSGHYFNRQSSISSYVWGQTNETKRYHVSLEAGYRKYQLFNANAQEFDFEQRFRFNNRLSVAHEIEYEIYKNGAGFAAVENNNIVFAKRKTNTVENSLSAKYSFSKTSILNFIARHYWSQVDIKSFYTLQNDGSLKSYSSYNENKNQNLNLFNIDLVYTWQFAPGSFVNVVWKNAISHFTNQIDNKYFSNLENTFSSQQNNNISLRVIYYLDYLNLKRKG